MDLRKVKKLIELLEASNLNEMEIREGEESIRLSRGGQVLNVTAPQFHSPTPLIPCRPEAVEPGFDEIQGPEGHRIFSPMVGTYYASSKPDVAPFVTVGSEVSAGDTLCLIEAMKIFNQIEADKSGVVVAIQKESGDAVEYGELLFVIQ